MSTYIINNYHYGNIKPGDFIGNSVNTISITPNSQFLIKELYERLLKLEREKTVETKSAITNIQADENKWFDSYMTKEQIKELETIIEILSKRYELTHLICFGCKNYLINEFSCFAELKWESNLHYFLLLITKGKTRYEHEIQDYLNTHVTTFKTTAVAHGFDAVAEAIGEGNRFFIEACHAGVYLYHDGETLFSKDFPEPNPKEVLAKAEKRFHNHIKMSSGFLEAAGGSITMAQQYASGVFMLHQAVEQACIALIKVHMGYRIDLHSLTRLLNLCKSFSDKPAAIFLNEDEETLRLFRLLNRSYGDARYKSDFAVSPEDAENLLTQVTNFVSLAEDLCLEWINALRITCANDTETIVELQQV